MRRTSFLALALFLATITTVRAGDEKPLADELKELDEKLEKETAEFDAAYQKAVEDGSTNGFTEAKLAELKRLRAKNPAYELLPKIRDLGARAQGTSTGLNALLKVIAWPLSHGNDLYEIKEVAEAARSIVADYAETPGLDGWVPCISYALASNKGGIAAIEDGLGNLIAKTPHVRMKASAAFTLAQRLVFAHELPKERRLKACDLLAMAQQLGEAPYAADAKEFAALHPRSQIENEKVVEPLPVSELEMGKVAPEIDFGEDQDGKTFKLSDYRGKVVVLVFWGFW